MEPDKVVLGPRLYMSSGRLQLGTADAVYSDGAAYRPALVLCEYLGSKLPTLKQVLVIGGGLGSMVEVLAKYKTYPAVTLVEIDKQVLQWALAHLEDKRTGTINPVCADAAIYMQHNEQQYDLVFIDLFVGRVVPEFVTKEAFLKQCQKSVQAGGYCAMNYIVNNETEWQDVQALFSKVCPTHVVLKNGLNRVLVGVR